MATIPGGEQAKYCEECMGRGNRQELNAKGECPSCSFSFSEAIGGIASLPVVLPMALLADITGSERMEKAATQIMEGAVEMGKEVLPEVGKAMLAGAAFWAGKKIWNSFSKRSPSA